MTFPIITRSLADTGDTLPLLNQCWLTPAPTGYHGDPHMTRLTGGNVTCTYSTDANATNTRQRFDLTGPEGSVKNTILGSFGSFFWFLTFSILYLLLQHKWWRC